MPINESVINIAKTWLEREGGWKQLAQNLREKPPTTFEDAMEKSLICKTNAKKASSSFAAIDGGIACEEFHGLDIIISRSIAARFSYVEGKLSSHAYFPSSRPEFEIDARSGLEQFEKLRYISLIRLSSELKCAINSLKEWELSYLLLDGSIAPLVADKPPSDSELMPLYMEVVNLYLSLYSLCKAKNVNLVGITKDSRGRRFLEILKQADFSLSSSLSHATDTVFLDHLLQEGERTFAFRYSHSPSKNQIFKDLGDWASNILAFYIKPVAGDRPLRVEFLSNSLSYDELAAEISGICALHPHYAYPAVLIEADLRAAIEPNEVEHTLADLRLRLGKNKPLLSLRRNSRPFR
ncbi:hypothetical protein COU37_02745 [Candidatus Micrarchaeota archaeon CG10_big_fil_rev_8_21_14_0_10_45_29]|nr:MAG: hypothetical protein COU37_02745 [Candidatus Micrarchaeota archaeon CG10_big_fil_rev_8_21_14_0_10_45_29]